MGKAELIAQLRSEMEALAPSGALGQGADENDGTDANGHSRVQTDALRDQAKTDDGQHGAFRKIVDLLAASDKSEFSLRERLARAGFGSQDIDAAISRAKEYGYVDDARYADAFVRSRVAQKRGSAGIERDLKVQGIDPFVLDGWPHEYGIDDDLELERALECLEKQPPKSKNLHDSAYRKLMNRGFPVSVSARAARMWCEQSRLD